MVDHRQPHTYSNELYKGIMMGESTGVFNGRIYVRPEAQKTSALQTNNNLVLSSSATLYTKPQLEIWADDVKCSHGATTGQLDEEQIFYLRTRGLHEDTARYLLQRAFSDEVINKIPLATLRTQLHNSLTNQENQRMV
jgi:Fe-S cluster assembly protein SufD